MKTTSLFAIIVAVLLAIIVITVVLRSTKKIENRRCYNFVIKLSNFLLIMIGCLYILSPSNISFYLGDEQKRNIELHLPQIDSSMQLVIFDRYLIKYESIAKDPIRHEIKTIYRDLFGYDRIEDVFVNEKLNVKMKVEFTFPNIFQHSKRINTISWRKCDNKYIDNEITTQELDSILKSWGLQDRTYNTIWK
ncbi:MAG: hypothetical protein PHP34_06515 [Bacteroidales bacterium]|nr:hypothetical protein [Bacteroidales bacterium]